MSPRAPSSAPSRVADAATPRAREARARHRIRVRGVVQGVGFRPFVHARATRLGLGGWVANDGDGVILEVEGDPAALDAFARALRDEPPPLAVVAHVEIAPVPPRGARTFHVDGSRAAATGDAARPAGIPADVATCDDCVRELHDPRDRRFRYPFLNCTNCGPRLTIVRATPYDRARTTMADFPLCADCAREYADPTDRRFHAEPIACPACGPRLWFERAGAPCPTLDAPRAPRPPDDTPDGTPDAPPIGDAAIAAALAALRAGAIVAIKGIGGFHLCCDATDEDAVARLRARKGRPAKPFAVMVADLAQARRHAHVADADARLLADRARPIVLCATRDAATGDDATRDNTRHDVHDAATDESDDRRAAPLAPSVAPGVGLVGLLLPYAPLHHLLAAAMPLVCTSGNLSDEPIETDNAGARARLGALADAFLLHDRPIHAPCDDSVARVLDGAPALLRRGRGHAPVPLALVGDGPCVLAVGGDLKAALALARDDRAIVGPHVGDLAALETQRAHAASAAHLLDAWRARPDAIACDLHPGYHGTAWAEREATARGVPCVRVQHHHAHAAAVLAEHGCTDRVLAVVLDGTGYGTDGTIWGGELLAADATTVTRLAHLAPIPLPGGDAAVRHPRRVALAWLRAAGVPWDDALPPVAATPRAERAVLARQLARGTACVPTSSAGRLVDALASLAGGRHAVQYEAQAAMEWEALARAAIDGADAATRVAGAPWRVAVGDAAAWTAAASGGPPVALDPSPIVRGVAARVRDGALPPAGARTLARDGHAALAALWVDACRAARAATGHGTVALGGGVYQNAILLAAVRGALAADGFTVLVPRRLPANDGGLAVGQAVVARARLAAGLVT